LAFCFATVLARGEDKPDLNAEAARVTKEGYSLYQAGKLRDAIPVFEQLLVVTRKLFPESEFRDGHPELARILNNLGTLYQQTGQLAKALPMLEESLTIRRKLYPVAKYPNSTADLAVTLSNLGASYYYGQEFEKARGLLVEAISMRRKQSKEVNGNPGIAADLNTLGSIHKELGNYEQARTHYENSLRMFRTLFPKEKFPNGRMEIVNILNNIGLLVWENGHYEPARGHFEEAVAMSRLLSPNGSPLMATSLNNLGLAFNSLRNAKEAMKCFQEALAIEKALYPQGHPKFAATFHNIGHLLHLTGDLEKGKEYYTQALDILRNVYRPPQFPNGHPAIATLLNNLGYLAQDAGDLPESKRRLTEAMEMYRKLYPADRYPDGHPLIAVAHNNLAGVYLQEGQFDEAHASALQNLRMRRVLFERLLVSASQAEALAIFQSDPGPANAMLTASSNRPEVTTESYRALWPFRSMVTRMLEYRLLAQRAAGTQQERKLVELRENRKQTEYWLQQPAGAERDRRLTKLNEDNERLEREIAMALPALDRVRGHKSLGPDDLSKALPENTVFVDLVAYVRMEFDPAIKGKPATKKVSHYAAFMVSRNATIQRIELGPADRCDAAILEWRKRIDAGKEDGEAAARVRDFVWTPIARAMAKGVNTVYLAADGDLARIPWAALPKGNGRVLLEDLAIAMVPHGAYLLDQLRAAPRTASEFSALIVGDVNYASMQWPELPGTRQELNAIGLVSPGKHEQVSKEAASPERIKQILPAVRFAHLATHGQFQAEEFASEQKRAYESRATGRGSMDQRGAAAKNPLGYVGLVLRGGETMSGLSIIDLNLDRLYLVTLSACETGLGQFTGGKGVENLQLAFHLAGCPNVVASLWKVNDAATAALMAKFYHELWMNKQTPLEALRSAQLTIYRHPERIAALAGDRGKPDLTKTIELQPDLAPTVKRKHTTPTKLWAAFVLNGVGR